jgi:hypothetical protein
MSMEQHDETRIERSNGGPPRSPALRGPSTFKQAPRLLPEDLSQYVSDKPKTQDDQYDKQLAYALALVSGWAYADHGTITKQLRHHGLDADVTLVACTNDAMLVVATAYFIRSKCGRLGVLAFRGTEPVNLINWLTDTNSTLRPFIYGKVHAGFYANVEVVWDDISKILRAAADNVPPTDVVLPVLPATQGPYKYGLQSLYITGHSLGAAMAVIAAACLLHEPDGSGGWDATLRGIYTYGQPMVGDAEFVANCKQQFRDKLFRHVFNDDLVPRMPPRTIHDFEHFGQRRYSASVGEPWESTRGASADEAPSLLETIGSAAMSFIIRRITFPRVIRALPLPYSLDDHMPTNYIQVSRSTLTD